MAISTRIQRLRGVYYGWWLLGGSIVAMTLGSGVSFWSIGLYIEPLETDFGWSRGEVSGAISIVLLTGGAAGPFVGRWVDTRGARRIILIGAVMTAATYVLLATTSELWQWYLYSAINGVFRQMMFFIPFQALISRWFERRRGVALSILGTGFSLGGVVVVPPMRLVIDNLGWEASFVFSAIAILVVFIPIGALLVRNDPADMGVQADGVALPEGGAPARRLTGLPLRAALKTPHFWLIGIALTCFFFGLFGMLVHQIPLYESIGVPRGTAALIVSMAALCGVGSRIAFGFIGDRVARFEYIVIAMSISLIGAMLALLLIPGYIGIACFIAFWVVGTGGGPIMEAMLLTRMFGLAHFGALLGAIVVVEEVGLVTSPTIVGWIFDVTGSYDLALVLFVGSFTLAALLFVLVLRLPPLRFEPARLQE